MSTMSIPTPRMPSGERRESILAAATAVFGARSYAGTTTDEVAKAAGVSQPYVVRMFGTKQKLFLDVVDRAVQLTLSAFRAQLEGPAETRIERMGGAYVGLLAERGLLQTLNNAFLLGGDPEIGPQCRRLFVDVLHFVRNEVGMDSEQAFAFLGNGMLINTLVGLRLGGDYDRDPDVKDLYDACLGGGVGAALTLAPRADEPW